MNKQHSSRYHAYLLRCWQEDRADSESQTWRFSLEKANDDQRHGFADLDSLFAFLRQITHSKKLANQEDVAS